MILRELLLEIKEINTELKMCNEKLDNLIKRISILHNFKNVESKKPLAWLNSEERIRAEELKKEKPATYKYVTELLKLFIGGD